MPRTTKSATFSSLLGRQLRSHRRSLRLSQAEVARRLGVSTTYVQNVEAGRCNITVGQLARICEALGAFPHVDLVPLELNLDGPIPLLAEV
jgi:transcriptional regulator with XRE-family HTH domain